MSTIKDEVAAYLSKALNCGSIKVVGTYEHEARYYEIKIIEGSNTFYRMVLHLDNSGDINEIDILPIDKQLNLVRQFHQFNAYLVALGYITSDIAKMENGVLAPKIKDLFEQLDIAECEQELEEYKAVNVTPLTVSIKCTNGKTS